MFDLEFFKCTKCNELKERNEFHKCNKKKNGCSGHCRECDKKRKKDYHSANAAKLKIKKKQYYEANKAKIRLKHQAWHEKNKQKVSARHQACYNKNKPKILMRMKNYVANNRDIVKSRQKKYREKHRQEIAFKQKNYRAANIDKIRARDKIRRAKSKQKKNNYFTNKYRMDVSFKIKLILRARIYAALKAKSIVKQQQSIRLLGCSIQQYKEHLEKSFQAGMQWDNHGTEWHIDHIKPLASFDLQDEEQQKLAFNFKNTQALWKADNLAKGSKLDWEPKKQ